MTARVTHRSWWSVFSIAVIGFLMISLVAACGSSGDDDDSNSNSNSDRGTTATMSTDSSGTTGSATEADTDDGTAVTGDMADAMAVGACLQQNTTGDVVTDLRNGETASTEDMYRECLSDVVPESMASSLDPIVEQAGECGTDAAADLSDDDVAAIEDGDQAKIQEMTTATLECVSADLGIDLQ